MESICAFHMECTHRFHMECTYGFLMEPYVSPICMISIWVPYGFAIGVEPRLLLITNRQSH